MKLKSFAILSCLLTFITGCQKSESQIQTQVWRKGQGPSPALFSSPQFAESERSILVGKEVVRFSEQKWGEAVIKNGALQKIESIDGELQFAKARYDHDPSKKINYPIAKIKTIHSERFAFLARLPEVNFQFKDKIALSEPDVVLIPKNGKLIATYQIDYLNKEQNKVERFWLSPQYSIVEKEQVSSDFETAAWIYTLTHQQTLQEVLIHNLLEAPFISSQILEVRSQAPNNATWQNAPWKFSSEDPRFDQVQAFYFIHQGIEFFEKSLNFVFPFAVQVETAVGYPEKINAAFTYQNKIRLGSGDQVTYGSMAQDPSVVVHELSHIVTSLIAHLPTQKEGGSLNEGFCDFFSASFLNNPKMGSASYLSGPYRRNIEDFVTYTERNGGLYHDSLIVSGTLWEFRKTLGVAKGQTLAVKTLARLGPATQLSEFVRAVAEASVDLSPEDIEVITQIMRKRQWPDSSL